MAYHARQTAEQEGVLGEEAMQSIARQLAELSTDPDPEPGDAPAAEAEAVKESRTRASVLFQKAGLAVQFAVALVNEGEGADKNYTHSVPSWIHYARIPGMRYRFVYKVHEAADLGFTSTVAAGIRSYGLPGVPGWADEVGPVAILYSGQGSLTGSKRWFVFRKLMPFPGQGHKEAPLLLGTAKYVRLTRREVSRFRPGHEVCSVLIANGGGEQREYLDALSPRERYRFWLSWSHPSEPMAESVKPLRTVRGNDSSVSALLRAARCALDSFLGLDVISESWQAQPFQQVDPLYYAQLSQRVSALLEERRKLKHFEQKRAEALQELRAAGISKVGAPSLGDEPPSHFVQRV